MKSLLVHGCFDLKTAQTLKELGVEEFVFDLRGTSLNLITFEALKEVLENFIAKKIYLKFQDETEQTIVSYLDLLKNYSNSFELIFESEPKSDVGRFIWHYSKELDYKTILNHKKITGVIIPLALKDDFMNEREFWEMIEEKSLDVYIHGTEDELGPLLDKDGLKFSYELTHGVFDNYRKIDLESLHQKKIWRILNAHTTL